MVKLIIGGDICATKRDEQAFLEGDATRLFSDVLPHIAASDIAIANLETPLIETPSPIKKSGSVFGNAPQMVNAIKNAGINVLNLGNNHILDHGAKGLKTTITTLRQNEFHYVGAGETLNQASQPLTIKIKDKTIAIISYAEHEFSIAEQNKPGANPLDIIDFVNKIKILKRSSDFIVLLYHGGKENYALPTPKQQKLCRFFVDEGVNMVVCQHSHTAGVFESYNKGHIYYGQGNYIFDPYPLKRDWLYKGFLIEVVLHQDNTTDISLLPYIHNSFSNPTAIGIRKLTEDASKRFIQAIVEENNKMLNDPNYVKDQWEKLASGLGSTYLSILNGNGRIMRKLNETFPWLKAVYKNDRKRVLKNIVTCETHREILETILKEK